MENIPATNEPAVGDVIVETVLVVDDMPENISVLGELLQGAGYKVLAANGGAAALRYATRQPQPSLVLLDVMMPEMDGHEVLRRLRENEATRGIPVIFLTALDDARNVAQGLRLGAADYIAKPIEPEIVLARVRTQLEVRRARLWLTDQNLLLEAEVARRVAQNRHIEAESARAKAVLDHQRELILMSAEEGIFGISVSGTINFINPAAAAMLGYERDELLERHASQLFYSSSIDDGKPLSPISPACEAGVAIRRQEGLFQRKDGGSLALEFSATPIIEEDRLAGTVVTLQDVSERRHYVEQLERKSNYDDLTGLPNRNLLNDRLAHAIERQCQEGGAIAIIVLDIDRFKSINDSLGHGTGDQILRDVAERLARFVPEMDTLARIEGDEFVLVAEASETEVATRIAQPLLAALVPPFQAAGRELIVTASMGIAMFPKDGADAETLLRNATAAMYQAAVGGNRFHFYTAEMNARSLERLDMENGLRQAIDKEELVLHYQPQVSLRTGEIVGAEALVRWQHPERGLVSPGAFIPLAEDTGLIVPLGEWVLRAACRQNKAWQDGGLPPLTVAVNLSARQFAAQDVVELAGAILDQTGLAPKYLELELTESAVMTDADVFIHTTERLQALSIKLSIDDFGTGFSSLAYLKRFAIDCLKIDQSFIRDVVHDPNSAAIVLAIISLAHSLKISVIAEGVETEAQLNFLRHRGCDEMQGFWFSKPLPAAEFEQLVREGRKLVFPETVQLPSRTLLLVDDEPSILAALQRLFRREGYKLLTAASGMEALDLLAGNEVAVVMSDARMPQMDGTEFLGKVSEMYPDTVRMILSGYTDLQAVTSAVNRGEVFRFLTKPWDDVVLLEMVREAFRHHELRRQEDAEKS